MSAVDEILSQIPMSQLADQLGVDEQTAEAAARQAIPTLLGGMQANAQDPGGERSLAGALEDHSTSSLLDGGVSLNQVDTGDGEKIISNIFGNNSDQVIQALGSRAAGGDQTLMQKLLPILAPIVLAYLAKRVQGTKYGDLLGPLLAGAAGGSLADMLNDMLGGGRTGGQGQAGQGVPQQQDAPAQQPADGPFQQPDYSDQQGQSPQLDPRVQNERGQDERGQNERGQAARQDDDGQGGLMDVLKDMLGFGRKN